MRTVGLLSCVAAVWLAGPGVAGEQPAPKALLDRALKAMGADANALKCRAATGKGSGKFHVPVELSFTFDGSTQLFGRHRFDLQFDVNGNKVAQVVVVKGDKGWVNVAGKTTELPKDVREGLRDALYAIQLATLPMGLKGKEFKLSALGELPVKNRPAVGVLVSHQGRRDVSLFFDKETGLPVKSETTAKDVLTGQEVSNEFFLSDYRQFDGVRSYAKLTWMKDGKLYLEQEITELKLHSNHDDNVFAQP
jgi:hypothetical protein